jgi:hypothetical protein
MTDHHRIGIRDLVSLPTRRLQRAVVQFRGQCGTRIMLCRVRPMLQRFGCVAAAPPKKCDPELYDELAGESGA